MFKSMFAALALLLAVPAIASQSDKGTKDEAVAMVEDAAAYYAANGRDALIAIVNDETDTRFRDRDLYVFVFDFEGVTVAHGANAALVGRNLMGVKDVDGKQFLAEMRDVAAEQGEGWVDYKWPNPVTKAVEAKVSFVRKLSDDTWIGVGVYQQ